MHTAEWLHYTEFSEINVMILIECIQTVTLHKM
jgi:hypothetical protein